MTLSNRTLHNFSKVKLGPHDLRLISYGLSFIPSPPVPKLSSIALGLSKLKRAMRLRWQFKADANGPRNYNPKLYCPNPYFEPDDAPTCIETYLDRLTRDLHNQYRLVSKNFTKNYRSTDMQHLIDLAKRLDLVVCNTDKNLGPGIFDYSELHSKAIKILSDPLTYLKITRREAEDIAHTFIGTVLSLMRNNKDTFDTYVGFISQKFFHSFGFPHWYLIPKIHKDPWSGRPICPSYPYVTHELSQWVSYHLNSVVDTLTTVCKDTISLVRDLEAIKCSSDHYLVTADVVSLYPSINTVKGMSVVKKVLLKFSNWSNDFIDIIYICLGLILTCNVFQYEGEFYLQMSGTAMGTPTAPPYANIFMFGIEADVIQSLDSCLYYKRYIDDILAIILKTDLLRFQEKMKNLCPGIVFTYGGSDTSCVMLDLEIFKGTKWINSGLLDFKIYQKRFNSYLYISFFSDHPKPAKAGFITGELLRYARNSSLFMYFRSIRLEFYMRLRKRGYPRSFLLPLFQKVSYDSRTEGLSRNKKTRSLKPLLFNVPYSRFIKRMSLKHNLSNHWNLVRSIDKDGSIFPQPPMVVYSKGKSVFQIIRSVQKRSRAPPP